MMPADELYLYNFLDVKNSLVMQDSFDVIPAF